MQFFLFFFFSLPFCFLAKYGHLKKLWFKSGNDCGFGCSSGHLRRSISYNSPLLYESERKKGEDGNYVNVNASTTFFGFLFLGSKREDLQWSPLLHYCSHFTMVALCLFGTTIKHACQARYSFSPCLPFSNPQKWILFRLATLAKNVSKVPTMFLLFFLATYFYVFGFETSLWVYSSLWWTWDQSRPYCSWHFSPAVAELVFCCMALCGNFSPRALISSNGAHVLLTLQERDRARELFQKEWEKSFSGKSFQFPMTEKASLMLLFVHVQAKVP